MSQTQKRSYIDRYQILRKLGAGGMGSVYLAHDPKFDREVVIKLLSARLLDDPAVSIRFEQEIQTIARLEHSAIVPVHDKGIYEGRPYLVMRYMSRGSLGDHLEQRRGRPISLKQIVPIIERIASALEAAHQSGIIHRDIKPDNILFDNYGQAHLADFGIAKTILARDGLTRDGAFLGTPAYMSPEQVRGTGELDQRADVYSLTIVLFQLVTGRLPYEHRSAYTLAEMHVQSPIPRASLYNPDVPPPLEQLLLKGMAKDPRERIASTPILASRLAAIATAFPHQAGTRIISQPPQPSPVVPMRRWLWGGVGGVALLALVGLGWLVGGGAVNPNEVTPISQATVTITASPRPSVTSSPQPVTSVPTVQPTSTFGSGAGPTNSLADSTPSPLPDNATEGVPTSTTTSGVTPITPPPARGGGTPISIVGSGLECPGPHNFAPGNPIEFKWQGTPRNQLALGEYMELRVGYAGNSPFYRQLADDQTPNDQQWLYRLNDVANVATNAGSYEWQIFHMASNPMRELAFSVRGCFQLVSSGGVVPPAPPSAESTPTPSPPGGGQPTPTPYYPTSTPPLGGGQPTPSSYP